MNKIPPNQIETQIRKSKNPLTEPKRKIQKTETPHTPVPQNKCRVNEEKYGWKEDYITIPWQPKQEKRLGIKGKSKQLLSNISTSNITEVNELMYAEVMRRNPNRNTKWGYEIRLSRTSKEFATISEGAMEGKYVRICWNEKTKKKKKEQTSLTTQFAEINQKIWSTERRLKRYWNSGKQCKQNRTFQNNERKFYQHVGGECTRTYQQLDAKEV